MSYSESSPYRQVIPVISTYCICNLHYYSDEIPHISGPQSSKFEQQLRKKIPAKNHASALCWRGSRIANATSIITIISKVPITLVKIACSNAVKRNYYRSSTNSNKISIMLLIAGKRSLQQTCSFKQNVQSNYIATRACVKNENSKLNKETQNSYSKVGSHYKLHLKEELFTVFSGIYAKINIYFCAQVNIPMKQQNTRV